MTIDIEKDDDATREMLKMMGEAPPENKENNTDELLDVLNELETANNKDDISFDIEDNLDGLLDDLDLPEELESDSSQQGEDLKNALSEAAEEEEEEITSTEPSTEDLAELSNIDINDEASVDLDDLEMPEDENIANNEASIDELPAENDLKDVATLEELESAENQEETDELLQANDVINTMQESLDIDNEIHEIAKKASQTAKQATALALEVTQQAQQSTEQLQQTIQATFDATARAFEALKETKFEVDISTLNTELSSVEINQQILMIKEKNAQLKLINADFMASIDKLHK